MSLDLNVPELGQLVDVRQRRYVVVDVAQSVLPPDLLKFGSLSTHFKNIDHSFSLFPARLPLKRAKRKAIFRILQMEGIL